jgi:hypothetical protein
MTDKPPTPIHRAAAGMRQFGEEVRRMAPTPLDEATEEFTLESVWPPYLGGLLAALFLTIAAAGPALVILAWKAVL